jgi:hypothetical protein
MKKYIALLILLTAAAVYALPPMPPVKGLNDASNVNILGGNAVFNNANVTGNLYASAGSISGLRTDTAGSSSIPYIDAAGNVVSLGLGSGFSLSNGNLTIIPADISGLGSIYSQNSDNVNITGGNISVSDLNVSGIANITGTLYGNGSKLTGMTVSQVADALSVSGSNTVGHVALIGSGSTLTDGGSLSSLLVRQVVNFSFADSDTAVTVSASKKGYVVPSACNGSNITAMTCTVYDLNSANANATVINLNKMSNGTVINVFDNAVSIGNEVYYASSTGVNATNAALSTGDYLFANVSAIADPAPKGLSCTFTFAK